MAASSASRHGLRRAGAGCTRTGAGGCLVRDAGPPGPRDAGRVMRRRLVLGGVSAASAAAAARRLALGDDLAHGVERRPGSRSSGRGCRRAPGGSPARWGRGCPPAGRGRSSPCPGTQKPHWTAPHSASARWTSEGCAVGGEALDRTDLAARRGGGGHQAGRDEPAVDLDVAGAALALRAAVLGAGEAEPLAQHVEQRLADPGVGDGPVGAVDAQDVGGGGCSSLGAGRRVRRRCRAPSSATAPRRAPRLPRTLELHRLRVLRAARSAGGLAASGRGSRSGRRVGRLGLLLGGGVGVASGRPLRAPRAPGAPPGQGRRVRHLGAPARAARRTGGGAVPPCRASWPRARRAARQGGRRGAAAPLLARADVVNSPDSSGRSPRRPGSTTAAEVVPAVRGRSAGPADGSRLPGTSTGRWPAGRYVARSCARGLRLGDRARGSCEACGAPCRHRPGARGRRIGRRPRASRAA